MSEPQSPTQALADVLLGRPVVDWIHERRQRRQSWRMLERDLREATDGRIDVTGETLRSWYLHRQQTRAAS